MTTYQLAPNLAWLVADEIDPNDENIYVMLVPDGSPSIINGAGSLIFLAVAHGEDPLGVVMRATGLSSEAVAAGVGTFLHDLHARGLIVRTPKETT